MVLTFMSIADLMSNSVIFWRLEIIAYLSEKYIGSNRYIPDRVISGNDDAVNRTLIRYAEPWQHTLFHTNVVGGLSMCKSARNN